MSKSLNASQIKLWRRYKEESVDEREEITSLDDIPDFDDPETEIHWWRSHRLSKELIDQIPADDPDEER